ncbi:hypothetical protein CDN99_09030 [Roseateles aquatilis]|uniref:Bacterial Ig-like domain-containing protein n=1 Tax=Roseateles aquatilis TaxID=431061 RepID=A0A246JFK8_9BURK|nr:hypothetical protein CDN99_09030 [Roseateles aquatilis]
MDDFDGEAVQGDVAVESDADVSSPAEPADGDALPISPAIPAESLPALEASGGAKNGVAAGSATPSTWTYVGGAALMALGVAGAASGGGGSGAAAQAKPEEKPPSEKPEEKPPADKPDEQPPVGKPDEKPPVEKPPVGKPEEKPPVDKPDEQPPVGKPDEKPPLEKPPADKPEEKPPVDKPDEQPPVGKPDEKPPVEMPGDKPHDPAPVRPPPPKIIVHRDGAVEIGDLVVGAVWQYRLGGDSAWRGGAADGVIPASALGPDGPKVIEARQTLTGLASPSAIATFILDTTPPEAPVVTLMHDSGISGSDGVTYDASVRVSGIERGANWRYSLDGGAHWSAGVGDMIPAGLFAADGRWAVSVVQTDAAGHDSPVARLEFTRDTIAAPLTVALLDDTGAPEAVDPDGRSLTDRITRMATVIVTGIESGATWQYSLDGAHWVEGHGETIDAKVFGENDGAKVVHVRQTDVAGNIGETQTLNFVLAKQAGDAPRISLVGDHGESSSDKLTNFAQLQVDVEKGAYWTYEFDSGHAGIGVGTMTDAQIRPPDGERTVVVRQYDGAGNMTTSSFNFTMDGTRPARLGIELVNDTGASAHDGITQDGTMRVSGVEANARWWYSIDEGQWFDGDSTMRIASSALGQDGRKRIDVMQRDLAGNFSEKQSLWVDLDREADAPRLRLKHDTGGSAIDNVTADSTILVTGIEHGATWSGYGNVDMASFEATGTDLQFETKAPGAGRMDFRVRQTDLAGNLSDWGMLRWLGTSDAVADAQRPTLVSQTDVQNFLMSGTTGADHFVFPAKTISGTARGAVTNYSGAEGDILDLREILTVAPGKTISDYVTKFEYPPTEGLALFLHEAGDRALTYRIELWNVHAADLIRVQTAEGIFTL